MQLEDYVGERPKFHRGRQESPATKMIREALLTGVMKRMSGLTPKELLDMPKRIRAIATKAHISASIMVDGDSIIFEGKGSTDTDTFEPEVEPEVAPPPAKRVRPSRAKKA